MKIIHSLSAALLLFFGSAFAAEVNRHVVLITIDGFPAAMMKDPKTPIPRIRELAARGRGRRRHARQHAIRDLAEPHHTRHRRASRQTFRPLQWHPHAQRTG